MTKKLCEEGNHYVESLFWAKRKDRKSACMQCAKKYARPISKKVKMIESWNPLNEAKSSDISKPKHKPIKPISDKQALRLKEYRKVRDEYFKDNPICEYPDCNSKDIQLHHRKGRIGSLLSDKRYFCSLCDTHHRTIELNPDLAYSLGLSLKRLDK